MRQYIHATRIVTKVKMLRSGKMNQTFLLVEGVTDQRLYSKFIDQTRSEILIADSKSNVIECVEACNQERILGIIGIVDADFWRLEEYDIQYQNLFLTDFHDLECMMLHSPAYDNVMTEYANRQKYLRFEQRQKQSVKMLLLGHAAKIGYLRWYSLQQKLGLKFSRLNFERFVNKMTLELDVQKLIQEVLIESKKQQELSDDKIIEELKRLSNRSYDLWEVCCGHDLIELLTLGLVNVFGEYNAKNLFPGNLEGSFRLTYGYEYFLTTKLYKSLYEWQEKNTPFKIFAT